DRDSRVLECPRFTEAIDNRARIISATIGMKEAALRFQNLFRAGPSERGKIDGYHPTLAGMPRLERFHHGSEVFAQARGVAGRNRECAQCRVPIEPFQSCARGSAAEDSAGSGGMKPILIMPR